MPQNRWIGGVVLIGTLGIAGVVLLPFFHHGDDSPSIYPRLAQSHKKSLPAPAPTALSRLGAMTTATAPQRIFSSPSASSPDRLIQNWKTHFPGGVLPYRDTGGGPQPGPPKQQLSGFTLEAQASDATNPLRQTSPPPAGRPARLYTQLTVTTNQPKQKLVSWELNQNGLSVEGDVHMNSEVSSAGLRPAGLGKQEAGIIQYLEMRQKRHPKRVIIHGLLRQSEDYEESLTFRTPKSGNDMGIGKTEWQSQETPSGVKVTLPPQAMSTVGEPGFNDILRLNFQIDPAQTPVALPHSPLYEKYHKPVLLRVGAMTPSGSAYDYPFNDPEGTMSLYKQPNQIWQYGSSPDVLTLVVQQRLYLREIPFTLAVPVSHQPFHPFDASSPSHDHF